MVIGDDTATPSKLYLGNLATVVVDAAFGDEAKFAGKSFNVPPPPLNICIYLYIYLSIYIYIYIYIHIYIL